MDLLIRKVSKRITWDFSTIDHEDIAQSLWEVVLIGQLPVDQPGLRSFLLRKGKALAWEIRMDQLKASAQYSYRTEDVRRLLEELEGSFVPKDAREGEKDAMAALEVRVDLVLAYKQLPPDYQEAIRLRYADLLIPESGSADQKRLSRAVKRLADIMNSYYIKTPLEGRPGSRQAISNRTAQYLLEEQ